MSALRKKHRNILKIFMYPDPTPDPTPFIIDFKDAKKKIFLHILFCRHYFSPLNTFMRKGKDPEPPQKHADPDPKYW
jgi:hypothetical protein